jgi:2-C-methyl-D-erythritol 2,4-cyclodiphosphate synthase/2-C-methyl-D-erythritol 4-phosphate cytidylyltransferase/2-C-methyl-D-erythritol 2,4-cyclodiphosphate synthase
MIKIGLGWDLHPLVPGRRFLLGGVEIPSEKGEYGHSDGDVLSHAIADALLGAAALGDIGELFPPGDPAFKDADSLSLLKGVCEKARVSGWRIVNLDCVVVCEKPKVLPWRDRIRASLAKVLDIPAESVFVKGKTGEGLGETGAGNAVEATAIVLVERDDA